MTGEIAFLKSLDGSTLESTYFPSNNSTLPTDINTSISEFISQLNTLHNFNNKEREEEISQFLLNSFDRLDDSPSEFLLIECQTKETRTKVHQLIKKYFQLFLESDTVNAEGGIQWIRLLSKHKMKKGAKKWRPEWPKTIPDYLQFILLKENIDTMTAISQLTKLLRVKQDSLRFCGTKDKRGITAQWVTAYRLKPSQLYRFNNMKFPLIRIGDFSFGRFHYLYLYIFK